MLTKADIEFIKRNRAEVMQNRTSSVILYHKVPTWTDAFTGDMLYDVVPETVEAYWIHYTSESTGTDDKRYVNGVVAELGDAFANFDLSVNLDDVEKVLHVPTNKEWRIRGVDKIGLGEPNRYYVLLGKVY